MLDHIGKDTLLRLKRGSLDDFNIIYYKYKSALYSNILKFTKDTEVSRDILQEVFITLWEKRLNIDCNQEISNWLFKISYYKSMDYIKSSLKNQLLQRDFFKTIGVVDEINIDILENRLIILEKAISSLSPQKKNTLKLCKLEKKSYKEAAKRLQISKHTVKEYLSSAISGIRTYIKMNYFF